MNKGWFLRIITWILIAFIIFTFTFYFAGSLTGNFTLLSFLHFGNNSQQKTISDGIQTKLNPAYTNYNSANQIYNNPITSDQEKDRQITVAAINSHISQTDSLILELQMIQSIQSKNYTTELQNLRKIFLNHKTEIETANNSFSLFASIHDYSHEFPHLSDELEAFNIKIELPKKLNELYIELYNLKNSRDFDWTSSGLEDFYQNVNKQNIALQQMSPAERLEKGNLQISEFVNSNQKYFKMLWPDTPGLNSNGNKLFDQVINTADTIDNTLKSKVVPVDPPKGYKNPFDDKLFKDLKNHLKTNNFNDSEFNGDNGKLTANDFNGFNINHPKVLVIIFDPWLLEPGILPDPFVGDPNVGILDVNPLAKKVLDNVNKAYLEMSHGIFSWQFDICEIKNSNLKKPASYAAIFNAEISECEIKNGKNINDYYAVIIYPGDTISGVSGTFETDIQGQTVKGTDYNLKAVSIGTIPLDATYGEETRLGNFNKYVISHELGHSLDFLSHANSYICGFNIGGYNKFCQRIEYGNIWDVMGVATLGDFVTNVFPHFNGIFKEHFNWLVSTPIKEGKYQINAIENTPLKNIPSLLTLPVDQELYLKVGIDLPCDKLYLEYRTPRHFLYSHNNKILDGLLVYCSSNFDPGQKFNVNPPYSFLLSDSICDPINGNNICHTNLGWDISFKEMDSNLGEVTIVKKPICPDDDHDDYQRQVNPGEDPAYLNGCTLTTKLDCNDKDPFTYPGAVEVCDGVDDNCDGIIDNAPGFGDPIGKAGWACSYCSDRHGLDINGNPNGNPIDGFVMYYPQFGPGKWQKIGNKCKPHVNGDPNTDRVLQVSYCQKNQYDSSMMFKDFDCRTLHPDAYCFIDACQLPCKDLDKDGFADEHSIPVDANNPRGCYMPASLQNPRALPDCNDKDPSIHPGAVETCNPQGRDLNCDGIVDNAPGSNVPGSACPQKNPSPPPSEPLCVELGNGIKYRANANDPWIYRYDWCLDGDINYAKFRCDGQIPPQCVIYQDSDFAKFITYCDKTRCPLGTSCLGAPAAHCV